MSERSVCVLTWHYISAVYTLSWCCPAWQTASLYVVIAACQWTIKDAVCLFVCLFVCCHTTALSEYWREIRSSDPSQENHPLAWYVIDPSTNSWMKICDAMWAFMLLPGISHSFLYICFLTGGNQKPVCCRDTCSIVSACNCHWLLLWPPYGIGQAIIFFPCGFCLSFFFLSFFIPCLISAAAEWMSTILRHMMWP